uniref:EGF-like domain-containing protein n=1 Tax=Serinus canaria TaxID=9135 RepID=A0A8C9NAF7_SERCA
LCITHHTCPAGYKGPACERAASECDTNPCEHGGTCQSGLAGPTCLCSAGYTGRLCERDVDECSSEPCRNGALCRDGVGQYSCYCVPGYQGKHCDLECLSQPCLNGGTCHDSLGSFSCSCARGFLGDLCDVNECYMNPCQNGGICENFPGNYTCHCPPADKEGIFYGGWNCTEVLHGCTDHQCQNNGICIPHLKNGQHGFSCICSPGSRQGFSSWKRVPFILQLVSRWGWTICSADCCSQRAAWGPEGNMAQSG